MILIIKNEKIPHRQNAVIVANDNYMYLDKTKVIGKQIDVNKNKLIVSCCVYNLEPIKFLIINDIEFEFADNNEIILLLDASSVIEME